MATGNTSRMLYPLEFVATKGLVAVVGSFRVENTGPDVDDARGDGFSITHTATTGQYLITLAEKYPGLVSALATVQDIDGASHGVTVVFEPYDEAAGTLIVKLAKEDTVTTDTLKPADTDNVRINFCLYFQKYTALVVTHA
jgi:hypothetical protein